MSKKVKMINCTIATDEVTVCSIERTKSRFYPQIKVPKTLIDKWQAASDAFDKVDGELWAYASKQRSLQGNMEGTYTGISSC